VLMAKRPHREEGKEPVVYVVDDEAMLLDLAEMILKPAGFSVRTFVDARQALAEYAAASPPPQVVVTDYAMNGMSGLDFINECRRLHPDQKIIMVSGTVDEHIYAEAETKPDCFLSKPYDANKFVATVRQLAGDRH
jgi:DNA-binding NtrC family response regulator